MAKAKPSVKSKENVIRQNEHSKQVQKKHKLFFPLRLIKAARKFLVADSYMYGPLLSPHGFPSGSEGEKLVRKEVHRKKKYRFTRTFLPPTKNHEESPERTEPKKHYVSQSTFSLSTVQHDVATPEVLDRPIPRNRPVRSVEEMEASDEGSDIEAGSLDESFTAAPVLGKADAEKVLLMLLKNYGGMYSRDLGIDVDKGDEEVEKWFLAVVLLNRLLASESSKHVLEKVLNSGLSRINDIVFKNNEEIADILKKAGYVGHADRAAARLRKLALGLQNNFQGRIWPFKYITDMGELNHQLKSLFGVGPSTRTFLRELKNVWPAVKLELDGRAKGAARHLQLLASEADLPDNLSPEDVLQNVAKSAGIDERDFEASLIKMAHVHSRHYRECQGGISCQALLPEAV